MDEEDNESVRYMAYNTTRAQSYDVYEEGFGKCYWVESDSVLWARLSAVDRERDSVLCRSKSNHAGWMAYEVFISSKGTSYVKRRKFIVACDKLFSVYTVQNAQDIRNDHVNDFFNKLEIKTPIADSGFIFKPKADLIFDVIRSADSATRAEAISALRAADMDSSHLDRLYQALMQISSTETDENLAWSVVRQLEAIQHPRTIELAYDKFSTAPANVQPYLLNVISGGATAGNYKRMAALLKEQG